MAANKNLDPSTCTTASEAFKYPLPQVRQFHRSLTVELDEKNARLRTLVGGSYRQLLGTAGMILQMREDIGVVEDKLGNVGKGCGRSVVGGMASGLSKLQGKLNEGKRGEEMGWLARMKVLDMCAVVVGRLLRKGGIKEMGGGMDGKGRNLVVAAKVLVLSRLLAKSLADSAPLKGKEEIEVAEALRKKLGTKLQRAIKRTLGKTGDGDGRENLVQALCAYGLTTSSGAKDVLRHFLNVRGEAITLAFEDDVDSRAENPGVLRALELYTRTLLDVQALVPRRLSEALASLKTKPLLKDEAIREIEDLRLDTCERWFGDQILVFTPYVRHDDLEGLQAVETLKTWAKKASEVLLEGFSKTLQRIIEFKTVVELRTQILEVWIRDGGKAKGFDSSTILNGFRNVINDRMIEVLESRVSKLHLVGTEIEATFGAWQTGVTDKHATLWDEDILEMEINGGATLFKKNILDRTHGRNDAVSKAVKGYQTWRHLIDEIVTVIDQLKKQRWDNDLEDIEDDLSIESRNTALSKEDPQMLQERLNSSLQTAYSDLHERITALVAAYKDSEHIGKISIYLLRILRDIRSELPSNSTLTGFGLSLIASLHQNLASIISQYPVQILAKSLSSKKVVGRALWEGDPELPIQPSPKIYKFLHSLSTAMADEGGDIWSPTAMVVLKRHIRLELGQHWNSALEALDEKSSAKVNGAKSNGESDTAEAASGDGDETEQLMDSQTRTELLIQSLFDILVLQSSLDIGDEGDSDDKLLFVGKNIDSRIELDASSRKRLQSGAKEYWKRNSLLFGLLA